MTAKTEIRKQYEKETGKLVCDNIAKYSVWLEKQLLRGIKEQFEALADEQRLDLFENYCKHCGTFDDSIRGCQCWNDE